MLILVRHGRTALNATRCLLGRLDVPLDELGERQAAALGQSPVFADVTRVVCSPLGRARQTAAALGRPVEIDERWIELDYGAYDGLPLDQVPGDMWDAWRTDVEWAPEGGESLGALGRRVREACDELWIDAAKEDIVVVSHVSPIKAAIGWGLGLDNEVPFSLFIDTASVHRIGPGRYGPSLRSVNETFHRPSA